jgi:ribosomal protein S18 acetylase RimI-like enzyme
VQHDHVLELKTDPASPSAVAALQSDPFYRSICAPHEDDPAKSRAILERYFDYSIQEGRELGRVIHLPNPSQGVAVWLLPQPEHIESQAVRQKHAFLQSVLNPEGCENYHCMIAFMSSKSVTLIDDSAWYLSIIAIDPSMQGQGLGQKLLEPSLGEADAAGATCYLETFSERNLRFYQRLGFAVAARFHEPITTAHYAVMIRPGLKR